MLRRAGGFPSPWRSGLHQRTHERGRSGALRGEHTEFSPPLCRNADLHDGISADLCTQHASEREEDVENHPQIPCGCEYERQKHIQALCDHGDLHGAVGALRNMLTPASCNTYLALLRACNRFKALDHLASVQAHIAHHCIEVHGLLGDYLVLSLAKCGAISEAYSMCRALPCRTVFSWTAIISAYADCCCGKEALEMFQHMQEDSVTPNSYTFVSLFKACGSIADLNQGKKLHALARIQGFTSYVFVGNTLVSMYGKCRALVEAESVFNDMSKKDVVSWNAMLSAYLDQDQGKTALLLYRQMQVESTESNMRTLILALQACGALVEEMGPSVKHIALEIGHALHALCRQKGHTSDVVIGTALLQMYGNCGSVAEAEDMFHALPHHDVVSWTALLSAYLDQSQGNKALCAYRQMHVEGLPPNDLTFGIVLQALRYVNEATAVSLDKDSTDWALEVGRAFYSDAHKGGLTSNHIVGNPLISMFGKFAAGILDAESVFETLLERNIVSWNAMLSAYVEHGEIEKGLCMFSLLKKESIFFTDLTFIVILQGCSQAGSLDFCRRLHFDIYSAAYDQFHAVIATLIHAYGSCGSTTDAQAVLDELPEPHIVSWNACVAGHARDGNHELSMNATNRLVLAGNMPDDATLTSILSACSHTGLLAKGVDYLHIICSHYDVIPDVKHYGIMVDLLGRAGDFKHVHHLLEMMPMTADLTLWLSLLSACRYHGNFVLAKQAFDFVLHHQPQQGAAYVLFANIHADIALEDIFSEAD